MNATPTQIVRCIKYDMDGDLEAGIRYCERIARNAAMNGNPDNQHNYATAAKLLRDEQRKKAIEAAT